jgi:hypothetical protein
MSKRFVCTLPDTERAQLSRLAELAKTSEAEVIRFLIRRAAVVARLPGAATTGSSTAPTAQHSPPMATAQKETAPA